MQPKGSTYPSTNEIAGFAKAIRRPIINGAADSNALPGEVDAEVTAVEDQEPVETLGTYGADEALRVYVDH